MALRKIVYARAEFLAEINGKQFYDVSLRLQRGWWRRDIVKHRILEKDIVSDELKFFPSGDPARGLIAEAVQKTSEELRRTRRKFG